MPAPRPRPTDGLRIAIYADAYACPTVGRLAHREQCEHRLRGRPLPRHLFHVTLHSLGDYFGLPSAIVAAAKRASASVVMPPFDITFDHVVSFRRRACKRPLVLLGRGRLAMLLRLHQALGAALANAGLGFLVARRFTPHVTLLSDEQDIQEHAVDAISWTVREFVLAHSLLDLTRHIPLARWPLRGDRV